MKFELELTEDVGTLGVPSKTWVMRVNGVPFAMCDHTDNPRRPAFWYSLSGSARGGLSCCTKQSLADSFEFLSRVAEGW
jgi:hypothetical protein